MAFVLVVTFTPGRGPVSMVVGAGPTPPARTSQGARMTPTSTAYDLFWAAVDDPAPADVPAATDAYAAFAALAE